MDSLRDLSPQPTEPADWKQKFVADDGTVYYDDAACEASARHWDEQQRLRRESLDRLGPAARRTYAMYLRTGRLPALLAHDPAVVRSGRAPRLACNTRTRGSRRTSSRSAGGGSDDPGLGDEGEPPSGWRLAELTVGAGA